VIDFIYDDKVFDIVRTLKPWREIAEITDVNNAYTSARNDGGQMQGSGLTRGEYRFLFGRHATVAKHGAIRMRSRCKPHGNRRADLLAKFRAHGSPAKSRCG